MTRLFLAAALALAACGPTTPPVIVDYHAPFLSGKAPGASARPMPRPAVAEPRGQRILPACVKWPDDCGEGLFVAYFEDEDGRLHGPFFEGPVPAPQPEPTPEVEPEPEGEPEPEYPAKEWGPA